MIIAKEKKNTNIAEYILYMWQVEDMIRACGFDMAIIDERIIKGMKLDPYLYEETKIWYADLVEKMKNEGTVETGHLSFVTKKVEDLETLHQSMLKNKGEEKYHGLFSWAKSNIDELRKKSGDTNMGDIHTCLTGLYGLLILRLQKKTISQVTVEAMQTISNLLAYLSKRYMDSKGAF